MGGGRLSFNFMEFPKKQSRFKGMEFYDKANEKMKKEFNKIWKPPTRKFMDKWVKECREIIRNAK